MARDASAPPSSPLWSRRLTEWSIVVLVLVGLVWTFERQMQVVQGQGERVMVWSTIAALRAALTIDLLTRHVRPAKRGPKESNPFRLLERIPANFAGEHPQRDAFAIPPGSWTYDPDCECVGYRLLYPRGLEPAQVADSIWFHLEVADGAVRIVPLANYLWFGLPTN